MNAWSEFPQPGVECGALVGGHRFKPHPYAKNAEAVPGMHVDGFAPKLARLQAIANAKLEWCADGKGLERMEVAATRAQLGKLPQNQRAVAQRSFGVRENLEARMGALYCIGSLSHRFTQTIL
jgi:hypothetical protein